MKKHYIIKVSIILGVIALDLITKLCFYGNTYPFLSGFISINGKVPLNTGAAWSMFEGFGWLFIVLAFVFMAGAAFFDFKFKSKSVTYSIGLSFVIGGTIGNIIDRIFLGGVRDFIIFDFWPNFPVFNLADSFLFIGCILLIIYLIFLYKPDNSKKEKPKTKV